MRDRPSQGLSVYFLCILSLFNFPFNCLQFFDNFQIAL